jgi:excisionase family DNA binding protein
MNKLVSIKEASDLLGVEQKTLRRWENNSSISPIRTLGGHRRYRIEDIQKLQGTDVIDKTGGTAVYCRVSSHEQKQKGDLDRQKGRMLDYCVNKKYTVNFIFEEVGSGMSDKRAKLLRLLDLCVAGKVSRVIVEHKDRLARFNINYLKKFFESHDVVLEIVEETLPKSYENELVEDMLSLISSFSSKIYGRRSAENKKKKSQIISKQEV